MMVEMSILTDLTWSKLMTRMKFQSSREPLKTWNLLTVIDYDETYYLFRI